MMPSEPLIRLATLIGVFAAVALWEGLAPCRKRAFARGRRWPHNLGLLLIDAIVLRLVVPSAAVGVAAIAEERGWGFLNLAPLPGAVAFAIALLLLDLAIYFQHVMFHAVPTLWRLHRVHHADLDFDVTTGTRFHPFEILISMALKCSAVAAIGAPPAAVLIFEVLLNATAMFNHANASLPAGVDRALRWLVVTPDMHRIHHSVNYDESSSNFGFNVSWWDRLFGTYRAASRSTHGTMVIGVDAFRMAHDLRLDQLLIQPFRNTPGQYPINRRRMTQA